MSEHGGGAGSNDIGFLKEAVAALSSPSLAVPMLLAVAATVAFNLLIIWNLDPRDDPDIVLVHVLSVARTLVQAMIAIAALRIINGSARPPWMPDGSFWASMLLAALAFPMAILAASIFDQSPGLSSWLAFQFLGIALIAPFLPWFVAIAIERPLAWRPAPWLRRFRVWLPPLLLWNFLISVPAVLVYQMIEGELIASPGRDLWMIVPGSVLSVSIFFFGLALASVACMRLERL